MTSYTTEPARHAQFDHSRPHSRRRNRGAASGDAGAFVCVRSSSGCWQARLWLGEPHGGHVALGLYPTAAAARQVARLVLRALAALPPGTPWDALAVWQATRRLVASGFDVEGRLGDLLPKYVRRTAGGYGYRLRGGHGGPRCDADGFACPEAAHRAAMAARAGRSTAPDCPGDHVR